MLKVLDSGPARRAVPASIYESATRDGLTRIFNKKYFMDTLRKEFAYCLRHRVPLSLVMFDIDHFKKINDTYGHPAGDYVLSRIAQKVGETVRRKTSSPATAARSSR